MPNHVTNIVTFKGEPEDIKAVLDILKDEDNEITFDKFSPMPEELVGTPTPSKVVSQEDYDVIKALRDEKEKDGTLNDWDKVLPLTFEKQHRLIEDYGFDNWYDWSVANWGTKWGAYGSVILSDSSVSFQTAWATPFNAMTTLSAKFPNVLIIVDYADEDFGYNVGQYMLVSGMEVAEKTPKGGSEEAIRMALEIQGVDDFYLHDFIYDIREEDMNEIKNGTNEYEGTIVKIIIENEISDENYPTHLISYLLFTAVEHEQFEYASELKKLLDLKKV